MNEFDQFLARQSLSNEEKSLIQAMRDAQLFFRDKQNFESVLMGNPSLVGKIVEWHKRKISALQMMSQEEWGNIVQEELDTLKAIVG